MAIHSTNKVTVSPDQFNEDLIEINVFDEVIFSLSLDDADCLAEEIRSQVRKVRSDRRLQQLIDEGKQLR